MWRHRVGLAVHCQVVCVCVFIVGYLTRDWWENIPLFYFIFLKDIKSLPSLLAPAVVVHLPRSGEPGRFLRHSSSSVRENVASSCRLGHERLRQKWKRVVRVAYMRWDQLMLDPSNLSSKSHRLFVFFFSNQTGKKDETKLYFGYFHLIIIYRRPSSNAAGRCRLSSDPVNRRCAHKLLKKRRRRRRRCDVRTCVRVSNATPALALMALAASSRSLENCPRGKTSNCNCRSLPSVASDESAPNRTTNGRTDGREMMEPLRYITLRGTERTITVSTTSSSSSETNKQSESQGWSCPARVPRAAAPARTLRNTVAATHTHTALLCVPWHRKTV